MKRVYIENSVFVKEEDLSKEEHAELDKLNADVNAFMQVAAAEAQKVFEDKLPSCGKQPSAWFSDKTEQVAYELCSQKIELEAYTIFYAYIKKNHKSVCTKIDSKEVKNLCTTFWENLLLRGERHIHIMTYKLKKLEKNFKDVKESRHYVCMLLEVDLSVSKQLRIIDILLGDENNENSISFYARNNRWDEVIASMRKIIIILKGLHNVEPTLRSNVYHSFDIFVRLYNELLPKYETYSSSLASKNINMGARSKLAIQANLMKSIGQELTVMSKAKSHGGHMESTKGRQMK